MVYKWLINWRTIMTTGLLVTMVVSSFLPLSNNILLDTWGIEHAGKGMTGWRVVRRIIRYTKRWMQIHRVCRWGRAGIWIGVNVWLLSQYVNQPIAETGLCLVVTTSEMVRAIRRVLGECAEVKLAESIEVSVTRDKNGEQSVEVEVDLEPILNSLGDLSPSDEISLSEREALTARLERIKEECYQHPASRALMERIDSEAQQVVKRLIEEALVAELDEFLGFARYERTGSAKPEHKHRSGGYERGLRTVWGNIRIRVPKRRCRNKDFKWQVIKKYERSFGPWLDLQLHMCLLGLSQRDLQEILHLSFGQVLSIKAIEHLTDVACEEMQTFRQARLEDTPPVLLVDGVNLKVMIPTGAHRINQRGQCREVKRKEERVLLAGLGVWPDGRYQIIYFDIVDKETRANWCKFFEHLVAKGLDISKLQLVATDGRSGFHKAIYDVFPKTVKHQRCIFHKLKNICDNLTYQHLVLNPDLSHKDALKQAKETRAYAILRDAADIYGSSNIAAIKHRLAEFQQKWASLEPKAARCFTTDFDLTLNYLRVPFPNKKLIRTTNLLERFFREFRSRTDEIGCFGSQSLAETWFYLILKREKAKHAVP